MAKILQMWNSSTITLPSEGSSGSMSLNPGWGVFVDNNIMVPASYDYPAAFILIPKIVNGKVYRGYKSSKFEAIYSPTIVEIRPDDTYEGNLESYLRVGTRVTFNGGKWKSCLRMTSGNSFADIIKVGSSYVCVLFRGTGRAIALS